MNISKLNKLCIGCGICAGICNAITMEIGYDQNTPKIDEKKCVQCGRCVKICPMLHDLSDEFGEGKYDVNVGFWHTCFEGRDNKLIKTSASGGIATRFLCELLQKGLVDAVITVRPTNWNKQLFEYFFAYDENELMQAAGSAYYPIEISEILRKIARKRIRVAIVGLPCMLRGIRNAMTVNKVLRDNILFLVGLACGGLNDKKQVEYVAAHFGIQRNDIKQVMYRKKLENVECRDCMMTLVKKDDTKYQSFYYVPDQITDADKSFGKCYLNKIFAFQGCQSCTDALAETADIVFMDAWLPEYKTEVYGRSLILTRTEQTTQICRQLDLDSNVEIHEITVERIIQAQRLVNLIQSKKEEAWIRRKLLRIKNHKIHLVPGKTNFRAVPMKRKLKLFIKAVFQLQLRNYAVNEWEKVRAGKMTLQLFDEKIEKRLIHK